MKEMMKKVLGLMLVLVVVLGMTSCSSTGSDETVAEDNTVVFGYIAYNMADIWNAYSAEAFEYAAAQVGVDTVILDSENDLEKSIACMETLIQQEVDGISIFPISPEQVSTLIGMANDAGIPVTVENLEPSDSAGDYISTVACLYGDIGYAAIEYISNTVEEPKVFFAAGAKGAGVYETYQEGIDQALIDFPNVQIVGTEHGDWETEKTMNITQNFIQSGSEFNVIFANNDLMAKGAYNALVEAGMEDVPIISTGGSPDGIQMMKDGIESANMTAPVSIQGAKTFKNLYESVVLGNTEIEKFTPLPIIPVSLDTIDSYVSWDDYAAALEFIGGIQ